MRRKRDFKTVLVSAAFGAVTALLAFGGLVTHWVGGTYALRDTFKYAMAMKLVDEAFIGETDSAAVRNSVYHAIVESLDDRWCYYMSAQDYERYTQYTGGSYEGIGVTIEADGESGGQRILSVVEESPAERAGIRVGDVIIGIGGSDTRGLPLTEASGLIRDYDESTEIPITLLGDDGAERSVTVRRETIKRVLVEGRLLDDGVGYVRITRFDTGSGEDFVRVVDELIESGASSLVFDVRSNPGGKVDELLIMLDKLLPEGVIFLREDRSGEPRENKSDPECIELPMAVLVNGDSYSAAEFFAVALREYDWASIVGERTTGKNRAQVTFRLPDGSALHMSISRYLTPIERLDLAQTEGLTPDIVRALEEGELPAFIPKTGESKLDSQVRAALETLALQP